jgi:hypothetical protein
MTGTNAARFKEMGEVHGLGFQVQGSEVQGSKVQGS